MKVNFLQLLNIPLNSSILLVLKLLKTYEDKKVFFLNATKFNDAIDIPFDKNPPYIIMVIVAVLGFIAQVVNSIMNSIIGLD